MEDQFTEEDYEIILTYHHGIMGVYVKCSRRLKLSSIKRVYRPSPMIQKFETEEDL